MADATDVEYQQREENAMEEGGLAVELAVLAVIASRLRKVDENTTYALARAWQAEDMAAIQRLLGSGARLLSVRSDGIMHGMAESSDEWAGKFYESAGVLQRPVVEDPFLSQTLSAGKKSNVANIEGLCRTSVLRIQAPDGTLMRIDEAYKAIVDFAIQSILQGETAYEKAIQKAVWKLSQAGLRVQYASGATRELYAAVAQNVMDGFRLTMQEVRDQQAQQFKADGVEVSAHGMCADDHLPYQGRQFTKAEFDAIQRKLKRPIGKGYNCRHMVTGVILGVSSDAYSEKRRKALAKESTRKTGVKTSDGRDMTAYEFSQWQRRQEAEIRKLKAQAVVHDKAGLDAKEFREKAAEKTKAYRELSKKAGVETRLERTWISTKL